MRHKQYGDDLEHLLIIIVLANVKGRLK